MRAWCIPDCATAGATRIGGINMAQHYFQIRHDGATAHVRLRESVSPNVSALKVRSLCSCHHPTAQAPPPLIRNMSLAGKSVVILGATGNVGSGAAHALLAQGATVVLVGRDSAKLQALKTKLGNAANAHIVEGKFDTEHHAASTRDHVLKALGGKQYDHVISSLAFFNNAAAWATATPLADVQKALKDGFEPHFNAAHAFLPSLKNVEGSSFTIVSGGLAHFTPAPALWLATLKNATLNTFTNVLVAETAADKVRVNCFCIHFGIAEFDGKKNQMGMDSVDTREVGPWFVGLIKNDKLKGKVLCGTSLPEALKLVA